MKQKHEIAIIDTNILSCIGLKSIFEGMIPHATIRIFQDFGSFIDDTPDLYAHYFISTQIYLAHNFFFTHRKDKTIVLSSDNQQSLLTDVRTLVVNQPEEKLVKEILKLHHHGHSDKHQHKKTPDAELTPREIEVLIFLVRGYINKEIAEKMNISTNTVITHRKNITEKLGIKSVSALTIYAVMNGYIEPNRI